MRPPSPLGDALRHNQRPLPVLAHDERADGWVRPGQAQMALAERERHAHEALVAGRIGLSLKTRARERRRGAHVSVRAGLRGPERFGAGSSAVSLPISSSKSLASRKFL